MYCGVAQGLQCLLQRNLVQSRHASQHGSHTVKNLRYELDLVLNVRKRDLSPTALHAIALETINTRFPPEEWLHIYTDGSLLDFSRGTGIGVFSHLFSFYLHAGPLTTHFDGEVEAIHIALQQLAVRLPPIERAVILSDSTSALQALSNYNENNCLRVQNCRELLGKIKGKIVFQWVPSHCGLWGNERADFWAKRGTGILQNFRRVLTLHSAKLEIKRIFRESFRLTASRVARDKPWSTLCKKSHGIPSSPRAVVVAKFRLLTGHDCLCAHLFRFNLVTSPICVLCDTGQDMTAAHLDECSALNDLNCIVKSTNVDATVKRAVCALVMEFKSVTRAQRRVRTEWNVNHPSSKYIHQWDRTLKEMGTLVSQTSKYPQVFGREDTVDRVRGSFCRSPDKYIRQAINDIPFNSNTSRYTCD
ncbi:uncharacterized protein LOC103524116 [Trichonephila clavipes]|nr:uncharacterized protein LOC103524116 [Trichonephila clavipes]